MRLRAPRLQILDLYVLRRFALIYAANLLCFTSIFILIDAVTHYDDFARGGGGLVQSLLTCFRYYVALTPLIFCQILGPVVAVSSGLFTVSTFLRANEFPPILAAGRSLKRALGSILAASFLLSGAVFAIQELWIPRTVSAIHAAVESREGRDIYRHVKHRDGRGNLLSFETYDFFGRKAEGVLVLPVARGVGNQSLIHARSAEWLPAMHPRPRASSGHWLLRRGTVQEYDLQGGLVAHRPAGGAGKASLYLPFEERILETDLIPEDIEIRKEETVYMTLAALRKKMRSSPDQSAWTIKYYSRFAYPATNFILILLGLPVIVFFGNRNIFFGAIVALAISTAYFVLNSVFQDLGIKGWISPRLATGLAPILFLSLGATLYREMEG